MARLETVLPSYLPRSVSVRTDGQFAARANAAEDLGRGLADLAQGIGRAGDLYTKLAEEEGELNLQLALNNAGAAAQKRMEQEVFSRKGAGAEGSFDRAQNIYREEQEKAMEAVPNNSFYRGRFSAAFGRQRDAGLVQAVRYQREQVNAALDASRKSALEFNQNQLAGGSGDPKTWEDSERLYYQLNGFADGRNPAAAVAYDIAEAEKAGKDTVVLPNGTAVPLAEAKKYRAEAEEKWNGVRQGFANWVDTTHGRTADLILKTQGAEAALAYVNAAGSQNRYALSEGAVKQMRLTLEQARKSEINQAAAMNQANGARQLSTEFFDRIMKGPQGKQDEPFSPEARTYGSQRMDLYYQNVLAELRRKENSDPTNANYWKMVREQLDAQYNVKKEQQKLLMDSAVSATLQRWDNSRSTMADRQNEVQAMPDSNFKSALLKYLAGAGQKDTSHIVDQDRKLALLGVALATGKAADGNLTFNLAEQAGLNGYVAYLGFDPVYSKKAAELIAASRSGFRADEVGTVLAGLIDNDLTWVQALERFPQAVNIVNRMKGALPLEKAEERKTFIKSALEDLLRADSENYNLLWQNTTTSLGRNLSNESRIGEVFFTDEQLWSEINRQKASQLWYVASFSHSPVDTEQVSIPENRRIDYGELEQYAAQMGFRKVKGHGWYLTNPKD